MRDVTVMSTKGLKLLSNETKKLAKSVIALSKKVLKTWLKVQYNAAVFPIYFLYGGLKYVYDQTFTSDSENEPPLEPKSDVIVGAMQNLRKSVVSGINVISASRSGTRTVPISLNNDSNCSNEPQHEDPPKQIPDTTPPERLSTKESSENPRIISLGVSDFSGTDLMWDVPIISAKAKYFAQCVKDGKRDKIAAARKMLEEHSINNQMPKTRREYVKMMEEARNGLGCFAKSSITQSNDGTAFKTICKRKSAENTRGVEKKHRQKEVEFCLDDATSDRHFQNHRIAESVCAPKLTPVQVMHCEIATVNRKLRKIHDTCSTLLRALSTLNDNLIKVMSMKERLSNLEFQVAEGKRLLREVESDRFLMKSKLSALEELITEEELFLCDTTYESGFYENENNAETIAEL